MVVVEVITITMRVVYSHGNWEQHSSKVYFNFKEVLKTTHEMFSKREIKKTKDIWLKEKNTHVCFVLYNYAI